MDKRAQGLPITTIIIAILGIVVLVILFAITTGRLAIFTGVASECPGRCLAEDLKGQTATSSLALYTQGATCTEGIEKQVFGSFIARDVRGGPKNNEPIPCKMCCQALV